MDVFMQPVYVFDRLVIPSVPRLSADFGYCPVPAAREPWLP